MSAAKWFLIGLCVILCMSQEMNSPIFLELGTWIHGRNNMLPLSIPVFAAVRRLFRKLFRLGSPENVSKPVLKTRPTGHLTPARQNFPSPTRKLLPAPRSPRSFRLWPKLGSFLMTFFSGVKLCDLHLGDPKSHGWKKLVLAVTSRSKSGCWFSGC